VEAAGSLMDFSAPMIAADAQLRRAWDAAALRNYAMAIAFMHDAGAQIAEAERLLIELRDGRAQV
jgi:hypothetical protein